MVFWGWPALNAPLENHVDLGLKQEGPCPHRGRAGLSLSPQGPIFTHVPQNVTFLCQKWLLGRSRPKGRVVQGWERGGTCG